MAVLTAEHTKHEISYVRVKLTPFRQCALFSLLSRVCHHPRRCRRSYASPVAISQIHTRERAVPLERGSYDILRTASSCGSGIISGGSSYVASQVLLQV